MHQAPINDAKKLTLAIDVEFGKLSSIMEWCRTNCRSEWRVNDHASTFLLLLDFTQTYEFEFIDEKDYIAFMLKFK